MVEFPIPDADLRHRIWESSISPKANWEKEVNLKSISEKYELSGGEIIKYYTIFIPPEY